MAEGLACHDELMEAQAALGRARDKENAAGNKAMGRALNDMVISLFQVALSDEVAAALASRYEEGAAS